MADTSSAPASNLPCQCGCNWWMCFLQSWATPGGNLLMLGLLGVFLIMVTVILMQKYGPASPAVMFLVPIAGGFAVAITTRMGISPDRIHTNTRAGDNPIPTPAPTPTP